MSVVKRCSRPQASLDDAMIRIWGNQQADCADEKHQRNRVRIARICRQLIEFGLEDPAKPEPEQNLRPEDQYPGFLERDLDLFR